MTHVLLLLAVQGYTPAGAVNTSTTYLHEAGKTNITKGLCGLIVLKTSPVNGTRFCEHITIEPMTPPKVQTDVVYGITNFIPTLNITPSSTMCDLLQLGSNMMYHQLAGHGDIQPNPGPPQIVYINPFDIYNLTLIVTVSII